MKSSLIQYPDGGGRLLYLGGALGGAIVGLYQNGGYDESLQMRLARSPQRSLHRPDLFPHTPAYDLFPCTVDIQASPQPMSRRFAYFRRNLDSMRISGGILINMYLCF